MSDLGPIPGGGEPSGETPGEPLAPAWRWQEMTLALVALGVLLAVILALRSHLGTFVHVERPAAMDTSRVMRERRGRTLAGLFGRALVAEVDSLGDSPQVYLAPAFFALGRDDQLACMDSLYEAFYPGVRSESAMLLVYDARNRRLIGSYSPPHGLTLEE